MTVLVKALSLMLSSFSSSMVPSSYDIVAYALDRLEVWGTLKSLDVAHDNS